MGRAVRKLLYGYRIKEQASKVLFIKKEKKKKNILFFMKYLMFLFGFVIFLIKSLLSCSTLQLNSVKNPPENCTQKTINEWNVTLLWG